MWYKQSGFRFDLNDGRVLYIDPWEVPQGEPQADFIFITHAHFDHFDKATIERLRKPHTILVTPQDVASEINATLPVAPGVEQTIEGINFATIPAYNIGKSYHPKANNWVGYILTFDGNTWYHAGDTDHIPEMNAIRADAAFLPIGGTYTMDTQEAAEAANTFKPGTAIPMHYGFVVGNQQDGERFKKLCKVPVTVLEPKILFAR